MTDEPNHTKLEQLVERIHRLLEPLNAQVTWNDYLADPDNSQQRRQIDVSVRRDNQLTLIECRMHKAPQDVTWVEELIGRRISLGANSVIAVSTSGFTEGARRKATAKGVFLREFANLSDEEIKHWGNTSEFSIVNYEFLDVKLTITLATAASANQPILGPEGQPIDWQVVLRQIAEKYRPKKNGTFMGFRGKMDTVRMGGAVPLEARLEGRLRSVTTTLKGPVVRSYLNPIDSSIEDHIEDFPLGINQVIHNSEAAALVFDVSQIEVPDNCIFGYPMFHHPNGLRVTNATVIGTDRFFQSKVSIQVEIRAAT